MSSGIVAVRPAHEGEAALVASVLQEAAEWLRQRGDPLWSASELEPSVISSDVGAGHYLLAFAAQQVVGAARLTLDDPLCWPEGVAGEAAYLHRLAVRRAHAGGTVSRAIINFCCARARALGCSSLRLDCDAGRRRLRSLYEGVGFVFHSERVIGPHTVARYEKRLPRLSGAPVLPGADTRGL